jgi:hypothetical protein
MWNKEFLPVQRETVKVSFQDALRIRRIYRRLAGRTGSGTLNRTNRVREVRERSQAPGVSGVLPGVAQLTWEFLAVFPIIDR